MDEANLNQIREAISQLRELGSIQKLEALVSPDVFEDFRKRVTTDKSLVGTFAGIDIIALPEMPEGEMVIVPAGTNPQIALAVVKARRAAKEQKEKKQFTIPDERHAEWLNYLERKGYIKVVETKHENDQVVKVVDMTEEGNRVVDTQEFQDDKTWFFETGQLPKEK